jgi:hypothetical protein
MLVSHPEIRCPQGWRLAMSPKGRRRALATAFVLWPAALAGCSDDEAPQDGASAPTFSAAVAPILQKHCVGCHAPGRIAPFALTHYADAKLVSSQIVTQVVERRMPPWSTFSTDECQPRHGLRDDLRLSLAEIETLKAWDAGGALEGDPGLELSPPPPADALLDKDLELTPTKPFVTSGDKDQFRCFVLDPKLDQARYLNGHHIIPSNPAIVHHVLTYLDPNRRSEMNMDADGGYDCFGGAGVSDAGLLGGWAPGVGPMDYGPDVGALIPAKALLIMQVHYHPAGATAAPDATKLELRFNKSKPKYQLEVVLLGNTTRALAGGDGLLPGPNDQGGVEFRVPANAAGHIERMRFTIPSTPVPVHVYGIAHHMHYLGKDMKTSILRADPGPGQPEEECLLQTPQWDFTWQRFYSYDAPLEKLPQVRAGDVISLRCTYDNTLQNPFLQRALAEQRLSSPIDVRLGESTLDEMCLTALPLVHLNP